MPDTGATSAKPAMTPIDAVAEAEADKDQHALDKTDSMKAVDAFIHNLEGYIAVYAMRVPLKQRDNIIDASALTTFIQKIGGACMFDLYLAPGNQVKRSFSCLGTIFVVFWYSLFFYCGYKVIKFNETIVQGFHKTMLQNIGDDAQFMVSNMYVGYMMWKIPISIAGGRKHIQAIIDADIALREMGIPINYTKTARRAATAALLQFLAGGLHYITIWLSLHYYKSSQQVPYALIYQGVFSHSVALVSTTHYCYYLNMLRIRFALLNDRICEVRDSRRYGRIYENHSSLKKSEFNTLLAANMRSCAKLYATLTEGAFFIDRKYGLVLILTMLSVVFYLMLHIAYFIEAHIHKLFNEGLNKYFSFLNYVVWEIIYAFIVVYFDVYFCEWTKSEASRTAGLVHEVINEDFDPVVTSVCMQFSLQLMHQSPHSVRFYRLDYGLLLKEVRTMAYVLTFMFQSIKKYRPNYLLTRQDRFNYTSIFPVNDSFVSNDFAYNRMKLL